MKLFICKKSLIILISCVLAVGVITGVCAGAVAASTSHTGAYTVVIDAGHGGVDAGVKGITTSTKESEINLAIARYLRGYFANAGFNAVMTRTTQGGLYGTSTKGFKMRDMKKRKEIIEKNNADMVISVHQNFCPIPSKRGGTVFFDKTSDCGKALAATSHHSAPALQHIHQRVALGPFQAYVAGGGVARGARWQAALTRLPSWQAVASLAVPFALFRRHRWTFNALVPCRQG